MIQYSASSDCYEYTTGTRNGVIKKVGWKSGVFSSDGMFRKEEKDWKMVYLCRNGKSWHKLAVGINDRYSHLFLETCAIGTIVWKFELQNVAKSIDTVSLNIASNVFENGKVDIEIRGDTGSALSVTTGKFCKCTYRYLLIFFWFLYLAETYSTNSFGGSKTLMVTAKLSGGKGDMAWQHAQLFRQSTTSDSYPFVICFTVKTDA